MNYIIEWKIRFKTGSNQIRPGKFDEKHRFNERIEHLTLLFISSSLATVILIPALQINVHMVSISLRAEGWKKSITCL